MGLQCAICQREALCLRDRFGAYDGIPLGALSVCDCCGLIVCPDCLHEADCCFVDEDEHDKDPTWAPKGWERVPAPGKSGEILFQRKRLVRANA